MEKLSAHLKKDIKKSGMPSSLGTVISDIALAGKKISHEVQRSGLLDLHGAAGGKNVHSDEVQKLDERTNQILKDLLSNNKHVLALASEEEENALDVSEGKAKGYAVAFDPLDGSSNIDTNMPVGTIFSILSSSGKIEKDFLQSANKQLAAGYILYGSSTVMVFSTGNGVHEFTLDPDSGEFLLTNENIRIPKNAGYVSYNPYVLPNTTKKLASAYKKLSDETAFSMRFVGAMVADVHRTLMKGGFFGYPPIAKNGGGYEGKLRLQYECKPLGWLMVQAGGVALLDGEPINKLKPTTLHQKVGIEMGDPGTMKLFKSFI